MSQALENAEKRIECKYQRYRLCVDEKGDEYDTVYDDGVYSCTYVDLCAVGGEVVEIAVTKGPSTGPRPPGKHWRILETDNAFTVWARACKEEHWYHFVM